MIFTFFYIFFAAFSSILRGIVGSKIPIMLTIFLSTLIAIIFFHLINAKNIVNTYKKTLKLKSLYATTAFSILIIWVGSFFIPVYYTPTIQVFSFMLITSFYGAFFLYLTSRGIRNSLRFYLISIIAIIFYSLYFFNHSWMHAFGMLVATVITGSFGYFYFSNSKKLNQLNISATEILTVRFWPLFAVSLFFVLKGHQYIFIDASVMKDTALVGATSLIIPVYCAQKSIEKIGPELHAVLIGLAPFSTFYLEKIIFHTVNNTIGYLSIALFFTILFFNFIRPLKKIAKD